MKELQDTTECHERGSILVAAVFDAFFTVYIQRAAKHFRIFRAAGGRDGEDLPVPLAEALCDEATQTATDFFRMCVRALDYLPPIDVTFGDFLRAVMTSETDFDPVDREGIRDAWMQAFRRRGILPDDAPFFSEQALCWPILNDDIEVKNLPFGGPVGLSYPERVQTAKALMDFINQAPNKSRLNLDKETEPSIPSFHPLYRMDRDGSVRWDLVVEVVQTLPVSRGSFPRRGGTTMIISTHGTADYGRQEAVFLRYVISKPLVGPKGNRRAQKEAAYLEQQGVRPGGKASALRINFALVHGGD
jgi:hypothetical protein